MNGFQRFALANFVFGISLIAATPSTSAATLVDAVRQHDAAAVEQRLSIGDDVNAPGERGRTPLHYATPATVNLLLKHRANWLALDQDGNSPLHTAAELDHVTVCAALMDAGMTVVNARSNAGLTPLHIAAARGQRDVAGFLISKGADPNAKTLANAEYFFAHPSAQKLAQIPAGSTPLSLALANGSTDLADMLRSRGATSTSSASSGLSLPRLIWLPISLVGLIAFIAAIFYFDAQMTGWSAAAARFKAVSAPANVLTFQDADVGKVGLIRIKRLYRAAAASDGLYLATPGWLSFAHPPLLVPWSELTVAREFSSFGNSPVIVLDVSSPRITSITLRGGIAQVVKDRLASSATTPAK